VPVPNAPAWLSDLIARGLAEDPALRPTAAEALAEVDRTAGGREGSGHGSRRRRSAQA
jgi:hypothetical protein